MRFLRVAIAFLTAVLALEAGMFVVLRIRQARQRAQSAVNQNLPPPSSGNGEGQIPDMSNRPGEIPMKVVILNTPDTNFGGTDVYYGFIGGLLLVSSQDIGPGIQEYVFRRRISSTAENYFRIRGMYGERPDSLRRWTDIQKESPHFRVGENSTLSVLGLLEAPFNTKLFSDPLSAVFYLLQLGKQDAVETYFRTGQHPTDWPVDSDGVVDLTKVIVAMRIQQLSGE